MIPARLCRLAAATLVSLALFSGGASALTEDERAVVGDIAARLSSVETMSGEFVQFGPSGDKTQGRFYIARPGKVRFQYDPPSTVSVIADGKSVLVFDKKLQTYDIWPLSQTPLRLLLERNLDLANSDRVIGVSAEPDLVQVTLQDDTRFGGGTLTLVFDRATSELRQWTVTDEQGLETTVALYNVETGTPLSADLFKINYAAATNAARERN